MGRKQEVFGVTIDGDISGLKKVMNDAVQEFNRTERSLKKVNKQLELDPGNSDLIAKKQQLLKKQILEGEEATKKLQKAMDDLTNNPNFKQGYSDLKEEFVDLQVKINKVKKETEDARKELSLFASEGAQKLAVELDKMSKSLGTFAKNTKYLSAAFAALMGASVISAKDYESQIAGIKRVVSDLTEDTIKDLQKISVETGTAFDGIAEFATIGGALGIAQEDIAEFAKSMVDLNTATGGAFAGEEGAKSVVVFLRQLGLHISDLDNFGSAISVIGDKYADIGDETLQLATSLSSLATVANVSQFDLIGLAGVMADLGLNSESATSGITRSFIQIEKALDGTADGLEGFAKTSGLTIKEFREQWKTAPLETYMKFVDGLKTNAFADIDRAVRNNTDNLRTYADVMGVSVSKFKEMWDRNDLKTFEKYVTALGDVDDENKSAIGILNDVKLTSVRTIQTLLRLSGRGGEVQEAVRIANEAWTENTALARKANGIYDTTEKKLSGTFEALKQAGEALGKTVLPFVNDLLESVTVLATKFAELNPNIQQLIMAFVAYGSLLSPVASGTSKVLKYVSDAFKKGYPLVNLLGGPTGLIALIGALAVGVGTLASQMSKTPLKQAFNDIVKLRDGYNDLAVSIDNIVAKKDYDLITMGQTVDKINENIEKIYKIGLPKEEEAKSIEELKKQIDLLNEGLGYTAYWFDETTGTINDQNGPVMDLKSSWDQLAESIRKAYYIEQYQQQYDEALANQKQLMDDNLTALLDYKNTMEELGPQYQNWVDMYKNNPLEYAKKMANQAEGEQQKIKQAIEAWVTLEAVQGGVMDNYAMYQQDIDNFNQLLHGTPEEVEQAMQAFLYGFNVDPAKNSVDELQKKVDDLQFALENGEGFTTEYMEALQGQLEIYQEQLRLAKEAQETFESEENGPLSAFSEDKMAAIKEEIFGVYKGEDGWLPTNNETVSEIDRVNKESVRTFLGEMMANFIATYQSMQAYATANPIVISTQMAYNASLGAGYSIGGRQIRSDGFGFTTNNYHSGGIILRANFNVQSNNVSRDDVRNWSSWLLDDLNEGLGKQM